MAINLGNAAAQVVNAGLTLTLSAGNTIENVTGGALGDTITGNGLTNALDGRGAATTLIVDTGGGGNDTLTGGAGNDTYRFDTDNALGSDTINESGGGVDTLDFSATTTRAVTINLGNAAAQVVNAGLTLTLSADNTIENVTGGALGDTITGNALNNVLAGRGRQRHALRPGRQRYARRRGRDRHRPRRQRDRHLHLHRDDLRSLIGTGSDPVRIAVRPSSPRARPRGGDGPRGFVGSDRVFLHIPPKRYISQVRGPRWSEVEVGPIGDDSGNAQTAECCRFRTGAASR